MKTDISLKHLYGFSRPYDFERAIPFATAVAIFVVVSATAGEFALFGRLHLDTYRFDYFLYLQLLALLAAALSFRSRLAGLLILLCLVEFFLGLAVHSVLPLDDKVGPGPRFQYHPLLQGVPTSGYEGPLPYRVPPGGTGNIQHDSYGLRGPERSYDQLKQQTVIATLGGSTTYDVGVANGQTWSDALERRLGSGYAVLNHGVPGYTTVENLIQTEFYLDAYGIRPRCAIYYEGWNDIRSAHLPHLDPAYANFHLLVQPSALEVRRTPLVARISPLALVLVSYLREFIDTVPLPPTFADMAPEKGSDPRLENIFRANLRAIAAVNKDRGITTIFVAQLLNRAKLGDFLRQWMPLIPSSDVWPLQEHFNAILKETADAVGVPAFVPPIDEFREDDFVDSGHFSPQGAEKFAGMLAPLVRANCGPITRAPNENSAH
jgi:lysophospholipase L1-like esterase